MTTMEAMQCGNPYYENMPTELVKQDLAELEKFISEGEALRGYIAHPSPYHIRRSERAEMVFRQIEVEAFGSESEHVGYESPFGCETFSTARPRT